MSQRVGWWSWITALRPQYFPLPAFAALAGSARGTSHVTWRVAVAAGCAGLGWGVAQLLNDIHGTAADRINAPTRPLVSGAVSRTGALLLAGSLGVPVALGTMVVHPRGYWLALAGVCVFLLYDRAKPWPLAGNLVHGLTMAVACLIGTAAAAPDRSIAEVVELGSTTAAFVALVAAMFLQSNYEKDAIGDRAAAVRTLAHVLGRRASSMMRLVVTNVLAGWALVSFGSPPAVVVVGAAMGTSSALLAWRAEPRFRLSYMLCLIGSSWLLAAISLARLGGVVLALLGVATAVQLAVFRWVTDP